MIDRNGKVRGRGRSVPVTRTGRRPAPVYLGRAGHAVPDVYLTELGNGTRTARLKWLISTCLAAIVGVFAIFLAIYASMEERKGRGLLATLSDAGGTKFTDDTTERQVRIRQLRRVAPKSDRLQASVSGAATKHIIHETVRQQRGNREFINIRPYARIVARLAMDQPKRTDLIPPFNPFKLYAHTPVDRSNDAGGRSIAGLKDAVSINVLELVGGILPADDGLELNAKEVADLVARADEEFRSPRGDQSASAATASAGTADARSATTGAVSEDPNTTVLIKTVFESSDVTDTASGQEVRIVKVAPGDRMTGIIRRAGAEDWQARAINEQIGKVLKKAALQPGYEVRLTLVPSPTRALAMEPVRVALYDGGQRHLVTVTRDDGGDYVATRKAKAARISVGSSSARRATLYTSFYNAALSQRLTPEQIMKVLRVHAYDTDFSRGVRPGDGFEFFYDLDPSSKKTLDSAPRELLMTALTVGGETRRFYRYRTPDGLVDYYDADGNNSKRFLMRKPVKGGNVRFTSGFGFRTHPVLKRRKMHTGVDWAARRGTPIMAAGNGTIAEAGRKGGYGNHIRIRHANGYQTSYSHMRRFAKGMKPGVKVRQGQVIGYVGSTGLSTGPHLHYEVLVNNRQVNPMSIHVPRGRKLTGRLLADFQKRRKLIDDLMRREPVMTRVAEAGRRG